MTTIGGYEVHPDADLFPMLGEMERSDLARDIQAHGLQEPIVAKGREIWDGRNRLVACWDANVKPTFKEPPAGVTAHDFIVSANIMRRHLTTEQRSNLAAKLLKINPARSDRAVAKQVKLSPPKIAKIRKEEERRENILHVEKRADSKGRKQPASKPPKNVNNPPGQSAKFSAKQIKDAIANREERLGPGPEVSAEERKGQMAAIAAADSMRSTKPDALAEFKHACRLWLEKMNDEQKKEAIAFLCKYLNLAPRNIEGDSPRKSMEREAAE